MVPRILVAVAFLLDAPCQAEILRMVCHTQKADMTLVYDSEARSLQATIDNIRSNYLVGPVQSDQRGTLVGGRVSPYGHDYVAFFAPEGWLHNLYANGSKIDYTCKQL
jgi:hypothetical protein